MPTSFPLGEGTDPSSTAASSARVVADWQALERDDACREVGIAAEQQAAYFQLVEHPVLALSNLYRLYYAVAWNRRLAAANDPRANAFADNAEAAFKRDRKSPTDITRSRAASGTA